MKKSLLITNSVAIALMMLASARGFAQSSLYDDDLYNTHKPAPAPAPRPQIVNQQGRTYSVPQPAASSAQQEADNAISRMYGNSPQQAPAMQDNSYQQAPAQVQGSGNPYQDILVDDYQGALERRLLGFNSPTYNMPDSYYQYRYGDDYFYASAYDPAFYNVMVMGNQVWVEPKYITAMFGSWGRPRIGLSLNFGWNYNPYYWDNYYWGWGWPYYSYWNSPFYYSSWWGPGYWGSPYWGSYWGGSYWNRPYYGGYYGGNSGYYGGKVTYRPSPGGSGRYTVDYNYNRGSSSGSGGSYSRPSGSISPRSSYGQEIMRSRSQESRSSSGTSSSSSGTYSRPSSSSQSSSSSRSRQESSSGSSTTYSRPSSSSDNSYTRPSSSSESRSSYSTGSSSSSSGSFGGSSSGGSSSSGSSSGGSSRGR